MSRNEKIQPIMELDAKFRIILVRSMHAVKRIARYLVLLVAWLGVTFASSIAAAVAYEPLRSFGPTLYLVDGALLLGVFGLWRLWRFSPRIALFTTGAVVLSGVALVTATSISPAGKYVIGGCRGVGIVYTDDEYYELSGGVVYRVWDGERHRCGSYYKKDGQWTFSDGPYYPTGHQKLRFSVFGFDTVLPPIEGNPGGPTNFNRRRLIPFTRPQWFPE
jgi:hypothetical protein